VTGASVASGRHPRERSECGLAGAVLPRCFWSRFLRERFRSEQRERGNPTRKKVVVDLAGVAVVDAQNE